MTKRIGFFLPHFGHGGTESVVLRLLSEIDRSRFDPVLILQKRRGELLARLPKDVPVLTLSSPRPPLGIVELSRLYQREKIDLAVTVNNATNLYSIMAAGLARNGTATFVSDHTPLSSFLGEAKLRPLRQAAIRRLYPNAQLSGGTLDQIGADMAKIVGHSAPPYVSLPNPVIHQSRRLRPQTDCIRHIVSVGRLSAEKRFDVLIEAFALLHQNLPEARLTIYGEGSERQALEAQTARLGLKDSVRLPGYVTDMDKIHASSDLFVCSSRREGLGNAIIEAMARGVPVVSVDCPYGPRHLIGDDHAGKLVPQGREGVLATDLAVAIQDLIKDQAARERMTEAALSVAQNYSVEASVAAYEGAFERALERRTS